MNKKTLFILVAFVVSATIMIGFTLPTFASNENRIKELIDTGNESLQRIENYEEAVVKETNKVVQIKAIIGELQRQDKAAKIAMEEAARLVEEVFEE